MSDADETAAAEALEPWSETAGCAWRGSRRSRHAGSYWLSAMAVETTDHSSRPTATPTPSGVGFVDSVP